MDKRPVTQCYKSIVLKLIDRKDYPNKNARRYTLNGTNQNVWIPNKHLDANGKIYPGENIDYVFRRSQRQLYLAGITWPIPGIQRTNGGKERSTENDTT